ncbi:hypothetical protein ACLOJK_019681 [Asimina triloba]
MELLLVLFLGPGSDEISGTRSESQSHTKPLDRRPAQSVNHTTRNTKYLRKDKKKIHAEAVTDKKNEHPHDAPAASTFPLPDIVNEWFKHCLTIH